MANSNYVISFGPIDDGSGSSSSNYLELIQDDSVVQSFTQCVQSKQDELGTEGIGTLSYSKQMINTILDCRSQFCNQDTGDYTTKILVNRSPMDMDYNMSVSYGELSDTPTVETDNYAQSHDVDLVESLSMRINWSGTPTASWEGDVRGPGGAVIPPPVILWNGEKFIWTGKALGTIRVNGMAQYDVWTLVIPPREDSTDSEMYDSTVSAFWLDKVTRLRVDPPEIEGNCGGDRVIIDPDDDNCTKKITYVDGCTGAIKRIEYEPVACP